jgi:hypothetical protein
MNEASPDVVRVGGAWAISLIAAHSSSGVRPLAEKLVTGRSASGDPEDQLRRHQRGVELRAVADAFEFDPVGLG